MEDADGGQMEIQRLRNLAVDSRKLPTVALDVLDNVKRHDDQAHEQI